MSASTLSGARSRGVRLLAATCVAPLAVACELRIPDSAPLAGFDLLIVNIDTLRADHLGAYGYGRDVSPFFDRLAREGLLFEQAISNSSFTRESVAALFTGLLPSRSGSVGWNATPPPGSATLAERLAKAGYRTGFYSNTVMLMSESFTRGFESVHHLPERWDESGMGMELSRRALAFARRAGDSPFALYVHYLDPHGPYDPAPAHRARVPGPRVSEPLALYGDVKQRLPELRAEGFGPGEARFEDLVSRYDGEISSTDAALRALFEGLLALGRPRQLLAIVTADHGEEFLEHGYVEHGWTLYQESIHVPLLLWSPGAIPRGRVSVRVSHVDVVPTLANLLGLEVAADELDAFDGDPLLSPGSDEGELAPIARQRPQVAELLIPRRNVVRAVLLGDWKYVAAQRWIPPEDRATSGVPEAAPPLWGVPAREEVFSLATDPGERRPLSSQSVEQRRAPLAEILARLRAESPISELRIRRAAELPIPTRERLRALGYEE